MDAASNSKRRRSSGEDFDSSDDKRVTIEALEEKHAAEIEALKAQLAAKDEKIDEMKATIDEMEVKSAAFDKISLETLLSMKDSDSLKTRKISSDDPSASINRTRVKAEASQSEEQFFAISSYSQIDTTGEASRLLARIEDMGHRYGNEAELSLYTLQALVDAAKLIKLDHGLDLRVRLEKASSPPDPTI